MEEKKENQETQDKAAQDKTAEAQQKKQPETKKEKKKGKKIKVCEQEYNTLLNELKDVKDKHVRLYAEFDNVRKRMEREKGEFIKYASEGVIAEFIEIYDDLERSVAAAKQEITDDNSAFLKGLEMVRKRTEDFLKKNGVKPMEALGKKFDHNCHEVMMQQESDEHDDNAVIEVFQQGYYLNDKVIRTAKVKLAKNNNVQPSSDDTDEAEAKNM